jgi:hypothetical protein
MNKQPLLSLVSVLPVVISLISPAAAQISGSTSQTAASQTFSQISNQASSQISNQTSDRCIQPPCTERMMPQPILVTVPQSTAIVVAFPASIAVDVGDEDEPYPLTLPLAQAIRDPQGNVLIPENTPVSIVVQPTDHGAKIVAQSLVVNGHIVPIQASSPVIPSATITHRRANDRAIENGAVLGRLVGSGFGFLNSGDPDQFDRGAMLGNTVGMLMGLRSPQRTHVVQIPQGSVFVLALEAPIQISFE